MSSKPSAATTAKKEAIKKLSVTGEFLSRNADRDPRLGIVLRIANLLSAQVTLDELIALIMAGCSELLDAERSTLFLLSDDGQHLWSKFAQGDEVKEIRMRAGEGIAGWVAQTGRPVNVKDVYKDRRFDPDWDRRNGYRTRSMLCQPIRNRDGDIVGVAQVLNKRDGYFTVDDAMMLRTIMAMAAISLVNARLYSALLARNVELVQAQRDLEARIREIDLLYIVERDAGAAADLDEALAILLGRLQQTLPCAVIEVALAAGEGAVVCHRLVSDGEPQVLRFERLRGFVRAVLSGRKDVDLADMSAVEIADHCRASQLEPVTSGLSFQLGDGESTVGALSFWGWGRGAKIPQHERKLMALVAGRAARFIVTRLRQEEAEREDRLAALGGAIATIVHDFKTPMTIASGYAQMMVRTDDAERRKEMSHHVLKQLDRVKQMSHDVLAFARGQSDLLIQKVHLNDFIAEAEELLQQVFADSGIELEVSANYRGAARFDRLKLLRVVQNMGRNARDAMTAQSQGFGHRFRFIVDLEDDDLMLTFSDSGTGVPREFRHRMFEAFATHGKKDGTGLGLAMVKKVAQAHGGTVSYHDTLGGGATFEVRIRRETFQSNEPASGDDAAADDAPES